MLQAIITKLVTFERKDPCRPWWSPATLGRDLKVSEWGDRPRRGCFLWRFSTCRFGRKIMDIDYFSFSRWFLLSITMWHVHVKRIEALCYISKGITYENDEPFFCFGGCGRPRRCLKRWVRSQQTPTRQTWAVTGEGRLRYGRMWIKTTGTLVRMITIIIK